MNIFKILRSFTYRELLYYFSFISGKFIGNIEEKLQRITIFTNVYGNAMTIITLLYLANEIKANRLKTMEVVKYFDNKVY